MGLEGYKTKIGQDFACFWTAVPGS